MWHSAYIFLFVSALACFRIHTCDVIIHSESNKHREGGVPFADKWFRLIFSAGAWEKGGGWGWWEEGVELEGRGGVWWPTHRKIIIEIRAEILSHPARRTMRGRVGSRKNRENARGKYRQRIPLLLLRRWPGKWGKLN